MDPPTADPSPTREEEEAPWTVDARAEAFPPSFGPLKELDLSDVSFVKVAAMSKNPDAGSSSSNSSSRCSSR